MSELSLVKSMAENVLKRSTEYLSSHPDYDEILKRRATDVTRRIDMVAEEALDAAIIEEGISARVISEELGERIVPANKEPEYTLIMDPIDGSANLSMGIPILLHVPGAFEKDAECHVCRHRYRRRRGRMG